MLAPPPVSDGKAASPQKSPQAVSTKSSTRYINSPQLYILSFLSLSTPQAILFAPSLHTAPIPLGTLQASEFHNSIQTQSTMHSCEECSKLKQIAWSEDDEVPLSIAVGPDGQGETACPILSIVRQGVTLYKGKWGYLNKEEGTDLVVDVRITKDGVLEVDIRKHWFKILPIRIALVEFYVLPGKH